MNVSLTNTDIIRAKEILKKRKIIFSIVFFVIALIIILLHFFEAINRNGYLAMIFWDVFMIALIFIDHYRTRKDLNKGVKVVEVMTIKFVEWYFGTAYHTDTNFKILFTQIKEYGVSKKDLKPGVKIQVEYLPGTKQILMFKILDQESRIEWVSQMMQEDNESL